MYNRSFTNVYNKQRLREKLDRLFIRHEKNDKNIKDNELNILLENGRMKPRPYEIKYYNKQIITLKNERKTIVKEINEIGLI